MKDLKEFLYEGKEFTEDTKVRMGDSGELLSFLKNEIENLGDAVLKVSSEGVKYNNMPIPGTKLTLGLTAGEYADIVVEWINNYLDKKEKADKKVVIKKQRKNAGVPRGNYGAEERMKERERKRNSAILNGTDREINKNYLD